MYVKLPERNAVIVASVTDPAPVPEMKTDLPSRSSAIPPPVTLEAGMSKLSLWRSNDLA
jgi:hypothetical protein